jgi:uncharacterized membrane protein
VLVRALSVAVCRVGVRNSPFQKQGGHEDNFFSCAIYVLSDKILLARNTNEVKNMQIEKDCIW